jgi:hypothetical protein
MYLALGRWGAQASLEVISYMVACPQPGFCRYGRIDTAVGLRDSLP